MLGLPNLGAVSFSKGCYLGQEVVARAEHRGNVKRKLRRARIDAAICLSPGMRLSNAAGQTQATIINAVDDIALIVTSAEGPRLNLHTDNEDVNLDLY
jgi:folate-binding Fe-S cluster repair protein YgfZ